MDYNHDRISFFQNLGRFSSGDLVICLLLIFVICSWGNTTLIIEYDARLIGKSTETNYNINF